MSDVTVTVTVTVAVVIAADWGECVMCVYAAG
jgi:hypothetical protein